MVQKEQFVCERKNENLKSVKSFDFANHYAVIRSVIDTTIKNSNDIFGALSCLAEHKLVTIE